MSVRLRLGIALLLSLGSPVLPVACSLSPAQAQMTPQTGKAEANRLFDQGTKQQEQNQTEAAIATFQRALLLYREIHDRQGEGKTLKSIGVIYFNLKDYPKAIAFAQQVLDIAREIKDTDLESRALNNLGIAHQNAGDLTKGLDYLQQSLAVAQKTQNDFMVLTALKNLVGVYQDLKQPQKAIATLQQGLAISLQNSDLAKAADFLATIGDYYKNQEQYPG